MSTRRLSIAWVLILASTWMTAGCTHLAGGARVESPEPGTSTSFSGVVASDMAADADADRRYIFVIHGMGATSEDYSASLLQSIAAQGYRLDAKGKYMEVMLPEAYRMRAEAFACTGAETTPPCTFTSFGEYRVDRFVKNIGGKQRAVTVFTYFWNDAMAQLQRAFLDQDDEPGSGALINTALKRGLINDGFSDATAYLGGAGTLVRLGIEGVLCAMLKDAADPGMQPGEVCRFSQLTADELEHSRLAKFSFVSFSLGSRMLYDVLSGMRESDQPGASKPTPALARFVARTQNFFMAANQMPLLGLGRITLRAASAPSMKSLFATDELIPGCDGGFFSLTACVRSRKAAGMPEEGALKGEHVLTDALQVIAFRDPADLLGYRAGGAMHGSNGIRFIDIVHRNTPVILGLLALPGEAHAKELEREDSRRLILCGGSTEAKDEGRLRAGICR